MIKIFADRVEKKLENFWNHMVFHPTNAIEDDWGKEHLEKLAADKAVQIVRIYSMFEECVTQDEQGNLQYDFSMSDYRIDYLLEKGFTVDMYGFAMSLETAASLIAVLILGIIKLKPKQRYRVLAVGFLSSVIFSVAAYLSGSFPAVAVLLFLSAFMNTLGNAVFNASLMLAMPEENRGAIFGFLNAFSTGGCALSAVIFGVLCDVFPLQWVFVAGCVLSMGPMLYLCCHKKTREFVLSH